MKPLVVLLSAVLLIGSNPLSAQSETQTPTPGETMIQAEIEADAMRDMTPTRYYNKSGAAMSAYYTAWQRCRMIARGASPSATASFGVVGDMLQNLIAGGELRRRNRKRCMLIDGWQIVQADPRVPVAAKAQNSKDMKALFSDFVGSSEVKGKVTSWNTINPDNDARPKIDGPIGKTVSVIDDAATQKLPLSPEQALLIVAFRRPVKATKGVSSNVMFRRYDIEKRELSVALPETASNYRNFVEIVSLDKKADYEVHIVRLDAGHYVLDGALPWADEKYSGYGDNCLGAPIFQVRPGSVVYGGDFIPAQNVPVDSGGKFKGIVWADHISDAAASLASGHVELSQKLKGAAWQNGATYRCKEAYFDQVIIPGAGELKSER